MLCVCMHVHVHVHVHVLVHVHARMRVEKHSSMLYAYPIFCLHSSPFGPEWTQKRKTL